MWFITAYFNYHGQKDYADLVSLSHMELVMTACHSASCKMSTIKACNALTCVGDTGYLRLSKLINVNHSIQSKIQFVLAATY